MAEKVTISLGLKDNASVGLKAVTKTLKGLAVAGAAATAALAKAADVSAKQATIMERLASAVDGNGASYAKVEGRIQRLLATQQKFTRFGDTETAQALDRLTRLSGDFEGSLKNVTLAQDVAEGTGRSLNEAMLLVSKAMTGNVEALGEMLPQARALSQQFKGSTDNAAKADAALSLLRQQYGGAAREIDPLLQSQARLSNTFGDFVEALGDGARESGAFTTVYTALSDALEAASMALGNNVDFMDDLAKVIKDFAEPAVDLFAEGLFQLGKVGSYSMAILARGFDVALEPLKQILELSYQLDLIDERIDFSGITQAADGFDSLAESIEKTRVNYEEFRLAQAARAGSVGFSRGGRSAAGARGRRPSAGGSGGGSGAPDAGADGDLFKFLKERHDQRQAAIEEQMLREIGVYERGLEVQARIEDRKTELFIEGVKAREAAQAEHEAAISRSWETMGASVGSIINGPLIGAFQQLTTADRLQAKESKMSARERVNAALAATQGVLAAIAVESAVKATFALAEALFTGNPQKYTAAAYYGAAAAAAGAGSAAIGQTRGATKAEKGARSGGASATPEDFGSIGRPFEGERQTVIRIEVSGGGSGDDVEDANATLTAAGLHRLIDQGRVAAGVAA